MSAIRGGGGTGGAQQAERDIWWTWRGWPDTRWKGWGGQGDPEGGLDKRASLWTGRADGRGASAIGQGESCEFHKTVALYFLVGFSDSRLDLVFIPCQKNYDLFRGPLITGS